jgi:hypothetical protein
MMFAIPLVVGDRFGVRAGSWLKLAAVSGLGVTLLAMGFNLLPIVNVANKPIFGAKVAGTSLLLNLLGMAIYWNSTRQRTERELKESAG